METTLPPRPPGLNRWVAPAPRKQLVVGMGDMLTSNDAQAVLVTYSLGSCVGVTVYDPVAKIGGMLHAMLPDSTINEERATNRPYMFVDTGLPAMFHAIYALGGIKSRLVVKLTGGAEFLDEKRIFRIGHRNVETTHSLLERNGVTLAAVETGGRESRTIRLDLSNGNLTLDLPGKAPYLL
jgi:chemotaxis protein CheD